jgi:hypothetical protein
MSAVQTIRCLGFRKWYEHELLQSHAHLVLLLLATIALLAAVDAYSVQLAGIEQLKVLGCAAVSAVIGIWALRQYLYRLNHAQFVADQAVCRRCDTYAKWDLLEERSAGTYLRVCCRRCGHRWEISM